MTALLSTGKDLRTYIFYRLAEMKSRVIALCLMSLFSFPLVSVGLDLMMYSDLEKKKGAVPPETYADLDARTILINAIGMILIIAACVLLFVLFLQGLFTAKESMRHLWNKKYTDMDMSLPVSFNNRFSGDVISGFGIYILPQLIAAGIALLLLIPADGMLSEIRQYMTFNSSDVGSTCDFFRSIIGYLLCANVMQYFFSLMIISFCGRKLTANIVPFIFGLGIPCAIFFLSVIAGVGCYGVDMGELVFGPLWDCTPVGMILSEFTSYQSRYGELFHDLFPLRAILYSLAFGAAAYFMIKYRREERTGSAFVYKLGRYATEFVIMLSSASVIYFAFSYHSSETGLYGVAGLVYSLMNVPAPILITTWLIINIIVFVIIELVSREKLTKPKKLGLAAVRFAASAGLSFLICFGVLKSDGFGAASYVPDVSDISSIHLMTYGADMAYIDHYVELEDENAKKMITDFHHRIVAERPDNSTDEYNYSVYQFFNVSYTLKDGKTVPRHYTLPSEYTHDCMKMWFECGAFAESYKGRMPADADIPWLSVNVDYGSETKGAVAWKNTGIDTSEFLSALKRDIAKTAYEDIFRHDGACYIQAALLPEGGMVSQYNFEIWDTFEETRALLKEHNCDTFESKSGNALKYYMYKATSVGNYTTQKKLIRTFDDYGNPATAEEPMEYHILDDATAKELISKSAVMTAYSESRDIYIITPIYELVNGDGAKYYGTWYVYYVTEPNLDEAAGIYANAPAASDEEITKYLGIKNNYLGRG